MSQPHPGAALSPSKGRRRGVPLSRPGPGPPMRPLPLALFVLLATASAQAQPSTPLTPLQRGPEALALRQIEATRPLPGATFSAIKVTGRQDLYFLSGDGRILIKGTAYRSVERADALDDRGRCRATTRINLDGFAAIWPQLDPIDPGPGPEHGGGLRGTRLPALPEPDRAGTSARRALPLPAAADPGRRPGRGHHPRPGLCRRQAGRHHGLTCATRAWPASRKPRAATSRRRSGG